jgi:hypothetical protein
MELPTWGLIPMWLATLIGAYFLTKEVNKRLGITK